MTGLKPIKFGWKWLAERFNELIAAINARTITVAAGGGIDIQESPSGFILTLSSNGVSGSGHGGSGAPTPDPNGNPCGWQLVHTIDSNCTVWNQYVWGGPPFVPGKTTPN